MSEHKTYLGDGVYADIDRGLIKLTVENGLIATDTVYLDDVIFRELLRFAMRMRNAATLLEQFYAFLASQAPQALVADATAIADEELVAAAAEEVSDLGPIEAHFRAQSAFALASVLQLALRHPQLTGHPRLTAITLLDHIRAFFAACPAVSEMLRRGDDPSWDR